MHTCRGPSHWHQWARLSTALGGGLTGRRHGPGRKGQDKKDKFSDSGCVGLAGRGRLLERLVQRFPEHSIALQVSINIGGFCFCYLICGLQKIALQYYFSKLRST